MSSKRGRAQAHDIVEKTEAAEQAEAEGAIATKDPEAGEKADGEVVPIYVVKPHGAIYWERGGELRGKEGYAVRGDDPFIQWYFREDLPDMVPAMLVRDDTAVPEPPSSWPQHYRMQAGPEFMTKLEKQSMAASRKRKREEAKAAAAKAQNILDEIPEQDEL